MSFKNAFIYLFLSVVLWIPSTLSAQDLINNSDNQEEEVIGGADIAIDQGRYADAEKICRAELKLDNRNQDAWIYLCLSIFLQGRYSECRRECDRALQYFTLGFFSDLSSQTWYNVKNYDKALASFAESVKRQPDYAGYRRQVGWFHTGIIYEKRKQYHNAYAAYREAIRLDGKNYQFYEGAGDACKQLNLKKEALEYYQKSLSLVGKTSKSGKRIQEKLEALNIPAKEKKKSASQPEIEEATTAEGSEA